MKKVSKKSLLILLSLVFILQINNNEVNGQFRLSNLFGGYNWSPRNSRGPTKLNGMQRAQNYERKVADSAVASDHLLQHYHIPILPEHHHPLEYGHQDHFGHHAHSDHLSYPHDHPVHYHKHPVHSYDHLGHPKHFHGHFHEPHYPHDHHHHKPHYPHHGWSWGWGWGYGFILDKSQGTKLGTSSSKLKPVDIETAEESKNGPPNKHGPKCSELVQPTGFSSAEEIVRDGWLVVPATRYDSPVTPHVIFEAPKVPRVPPPIKIGITDPLPQNYSMIFSERMEITLRSDEDRFSPEGIPIDIKTEVYFAGDSIPTLKMDDLKANRMYVFSMIVQAPNISAPINGTENQDETKVNLFDLGLAEKRQSYLFDKVQESPLAVQVKLVGHLFTELQSRVFESENAKERRNNVKEEAKSKKGQGGYDEDDDKESQSSTVNAPMIVIQSQKYTLPDPASSEKTILDSIYNFGLQSHAIDFGDADVPLMMWDKGEAEGEVKQVNVDDLGCTFDEMSDNIADWVKNEVTLVRSMSSEVHVRAEDKAYQGFKQYQYFIKPNNTAPDCPIFPIDPGYSNAGSPGAYGIWQGSYRKPKRKRSRFG